MPVIQNKKLGSAVIRATANETINVQSLAIDGEVIKGVSIIEIYWTGPWTVKRGANTILSLTDGQDNWILDGVTALKEDYAADIVLEASNSALGQTGTIILEVKKYTDPEY